MFAELDTARRERLARSVGSAEQLLVTAAVDDDGTEDGLVADAAPSTVAAARSRR